MVAMKFKYNFNGEVRIEMIIEDINLNLNNMHIVQKSICILNFNYFTLYLC